MASMFKREPTESAMWKCGGKEHSKERGENTKAGVAVDAQVVRRADQRCQGEEEWTSWHRLQR